MGTPQQRDSPAARLWGRRTPPSHHREASAERDLPRHFVHGLLRSGIFTVQIGKLGRDDHRVSGKIELHAPHRDHIVQRGQRIDPDLLPAPESQRFLHERVRLRRQNRRDQTVFPQHGHLSFGRGQRIGDKGKDCFLVL